MQNQYSDLISLKTKVAPEWIDHNEHFNMGYYVVVFDLATDGFFPQVGLNRAHRQAYDVTTFSLEAHVTYDRELMLDDPIVITTRLIDFDQKRMHYIHMMYHETEGYLAATNELMSLHVDQKTRRAGIMAPEIMENLSALKEQQAQFPLPPQAGRAIGLRNRPKK